MVLEKLDIISQLEKGEQILDICHNVRFTYSSVHTVRDNADRIKESAKSGIKVSAKRTSYLRSSTMEHVETMLSTWIEDQNQCHMFVNVLLVQAETHSIYGDLSKGDDNAKLVSRFRREIIFITLK